MRKVVLAITLWIIAFGPAFGSDNSGSLDSSNTAGEALVGAAPQQSAVERAEPPHASAAAMQINKEAAAAPGGQEISIVAFLLKTTLMGSEWVLWLLLLLSVLSGAVMIDRLLFFKRIKVNFTAFITELARALNDNDFDGVSALCQEYHNSLESEIVAVALANRNKGAGAVEKSMTGYISWQKHKLDKGLTFLGTLGNNAPFIGLFGTVLGIIQAFHQLALNPTGGSTVVMSGISSALVATAVGLFVAIPAVLAFNAFQRVVKQKLSNADAVQDLMMMHFSAQAIEKQHDHADQKQVV